MIAEKARRIKRAKAARFLEKLDLNIFRNSFAWLFTVQGQISYHNIIAQFIIFFNMFFVNICGLENHGKSIPKGKVSRRLCRREMPPQAANVAEATWESAVCGGEKAHGVCRPGRDTAERRKKRI